MQSRKEESGLDYWALFPRLIVPAAFSIIALLLLPCYQNDIESKKNTYFTAGVLGVALVVFFLAAFVPHGVISPESPATFVTSKSDNKPSDWAAYGRTNDGTRYAPFTQINRENVKDLNVAWVYRTGDHRDGVDQNTPLAIDDLVYSCTPNGLITAIDADTGKARWKFDSHSSSPVWQRCRGLGYYKNSDVKPGSLCEQEIIHTTIDARIIALDAKTGQKCPAFGKDGEVSLGQHMGEVKPGFYFQTSAPTIARGKIIVGGWVIDNVMTGEPSGVIRAFDAKNGELAWAWDLGNPNITKEPPTGSTYTRGTPNMWTTAAYDDKLGLLYAPLGNATPDYYGMNRPPHSDEYNSSIVAIDIETGRERWKFQTTHHDIWDYDLPAQPALVDGFDEQHNPVPALLLGTKRGQIFYLNRATGKPLAQVEEKTVPTQGAVPEEKVSPTQPFSVGMPTIGAEHLTEKKMWGTTLFDQMVCRILFKKINYQGAMTPISTQPTLEQPGNIGGLNWGSMSVDPANHMVYMNDVRIPSVFWLVPRDKFAEVSKHYPVKVVDGHGPSGMVGTPYGMITMMWMSPLEVPCNQPPYGTITAVDYKNKKIAWQIPAGTAEKMGPLGMTSHLPIPVGMPTYAGTMTTSGGLVFFAGFQDYYIRAYDSSTGKEVWKYALPVGASATPMSYISPKTGKQYIVLVVGGAAHSKDSGDYVIAFALQG
ncbi:membrane-bound PQQ-dependent dehydrogenase, glucose/quinate/shikimate family [Serratia liquefaciens]|uniref:membrane-bound PQQ-dependent dehydrogenase, glucose/quinate/shikimate family n=1 Tax=Serratia liquefaciens TaxID=614 RepID=UPI0021C7345C|nr:membrane-bound PQQ-dependent dehydrogenase, glucose/quinate/shikimate family [Serratia liquefaciens]